MSDIFFNKVYEYRGDEENNMNTICPLCKKGVAIKKRDYLIRV